MGANLVDLWPEELIGPNVLSPRAILRHQAEALERRTNGLVRGSVVETKASDRTISRFEVEAPILHRRYSLLEVVRDPARAYPVRVISNENSNPLPDFLKPRSLNPMFVPRVPSVSETMQAALQGPGQLANNESEFLETVREILNSSTVVSLITSLVAEANEGNVDAEEGSDPDS